MHGGRAHILLICALLACRSAFRGTIIIYAFVIFLWVPLNLWMMPWTALRIGEVSLKPKLILSAVSYHVHTTGCALLGILPKRLINSMMHLAYSWQKQSSQL